MKSIGAKLIIQVTLVVSLIVAGYSAVEVYRRNKEFTQLLEARTTRIVQQLPIVLATPLWEMNWEPLEAVLALYLDDPDVLAIKVVEHVGTVVGYLAKDPRSSVLVNLTQTPSQAFHYTHAFTHQAEIMNDDRALGTVEVTFSTQFVSAQIQKTLAGSAIIFLCLTGLLILSIVSVMSTNVSRPVKALMHACEGVVDGDLQHTIDTSRQDEIGRLAKSFVRMQAEIIEKIAELHAEIDERKRVEEALRQSEDRFRRLAENAKDMIYRMTLPDGQYEYVSLASTTITGYTPEEWYANPLLIQKLILPDWLDYFADQWDTLLEGGMPSFYEYQILHKSGDIHWLNQRNVLICDDDGEPTAIEGIVTDVTERKRAEEEVLKLNTELEQRVARRTSELEAVNKELNDFAYIVSHDLKAPLRGIHKLAQWIADDCADAIDDQGQEMLELLAGRVKQMDNLIHGVLQYSRAGRVTGEDERIDLNALITEVVEMLMPPKHVHLSVKHPLPVISGNRTQFLQIFQNLLGNAVKFMDKPEGHIAIDAYDEDEHWTISVTDNGVGIDARHYGRIFQVFQTLESRDVRESTGIGLTIVKKVVELYGGHIWVESTPGQGSSFFFTIPKARTA